MEALHDPGPPAGRNRPGRDFDRAEAIGPVGLVALTTLQLAVSWRTWNHPLIDFGRELYTPWRLAGGAVLGRDVDSVYGPLAQYVNAGFFRIFGPGLMVLVTVNLAVFAGILGLAYYIFRHAWGALGAFAACATFVCVFAFSQYLAVPNFNYATPYAHEATQGMFISLLLVRLAVPWIGRPTAERSFWLGLMLGLAFVTKPEFILAGGAVVATAAALQWEKLGRIPGRALAMLAAGVVLPTAGFAGFLARDLAWPRAWSVAANAWLAPLTNPIVGQADQLRDLGVNAPGPNLLLQLKATALACAIVAGLWLGAHFIAKIEKMETRISILLVAVLATIVAARNVEWLFAGRCLLGLNLAYLIVAGRSWFRGQPNENEGADANAAGEKRHWRLLITVLAVALMARMALNGRIYQFGFYQAALAAMVAVAVIFAESPKTAADTGRKMVARGLLAAALIVPGLISLTARSWDWQRVETYPVGSGRDMFYTLSPPAEPVGEVVAGTLEALRQFPAGTSLLALPEGDMINYLARMPSPLPQFQFYSFTIEGGREHGVVEALERSPPELIVIAGRDLNDFGVPYYGAPGGQGGEIVLWIQRNYDLVAHVGKDPLNSNERGAYILKRIAPTEAKPAAPTGR